jgi:hypothetical protein
MITTFKFRATWFGAESIESEILTIQGETINEATAEAVKQINGVNSFSDCLIDLKRIT